jgi:RNA recognition motif-containing protein
LQINHRREAMSVRLFVGNLPYDATEAELREHFSAVGSLSYVYLPTDRESGRLRGFAFVEFLDQAQAEEAIRRFNNQLFKGRPLAVNEARTREDGPGIRKNAPIQPSPSRPQWAAKPGVAETPSRGAGPSRNFGPDAAPRRSRKQASRHQKAERAPRRPMRERLGGQFFGGDVDDSDDDDRSGEVRSPRVDNSKSEDNA